MNVGSMLYELIIGFLFSSYVLLAISCHVLLGLRWCYALLMIH